MNRGEAGRDTSFEVFWRRLLHRWFIQYNPLYVLSAALVLGGVNLVSRGLAQAGSAYGSVGAAAIAELYACSLVGGAALLTRIGLRRPAVMLALLAVLYQGDLTLATVTSVYQGGAGALTAAAWLVLFIGKLHALAWALRLRLSTSAAAVPALGALGVALLPRLVARGGDDASALVALWVFALFAAGLWTSREVRSEVSLDAWGRTVLRRSLRTAWLAWSALAMLHVAFWIVEFDLDPRALAPVPLLLVTRFTRREARVWAAAAGALLLAAWTAPHALAPAALMAAATLCLHALRRPVLVTTSAAAPEPTVPYRTPDRPEREATTSAHTIFERAPGPSMARLLTGALFGVHLSIWTLGWRGGAWPSHLVALDLLLAGAVLLMAWRARARIALVPLLATYFHLGVQKGIVAAPDSALEWGALSVGLGFGVLLASLGASWILRRRMAPDTMSPS